MNATDPVTSTDRPSFLLKNGTIYTADPQHPWADAVGVHEGRITAVGTVEEVRASLPDDVEEVDLDGAFAMPGLVDVHAHLGLGGRQLAFELPILPTDTVAEILAKVRDWTASLEPGTWVIGGIVGSTVMDELTHNDLLALNDASGGRPVLLRDDSMHNRWVNSAALQILGIDENSADPEGGAYGRDAAGRLTGVLEELACGPAEAAAMDALPDPDAYNATALQTAITTLNSYGVTAVQDAATMAYALHGLRDLDDAGRLTAHVVASMPSRPFIEHGITGAELYDVGETTGSAHVHPTFAKYVLDGVPMTRTSAMRRPYLCQHGASGSDADPEFTGEPLWELDDLVDSLRRLVGRGLHAKLHATGDAAVRRILDAVEQVRASHGDAPLFHIAHVEYIDDADLPRFAELNVVPDASPYLWFPSVIQESIAKQIPAETFQRSWPLKTLIDAGAPVCGGSDWPCAAPTPDPWTGLATLVTRAHPDPAVAGQLNADEALTIDQAIAAFTRHPAAAMGLAEVTGTLRPGLSADLIVLDRNLVTADPAHLHETTVLRTYFEGALVHEHAETR